MISLYTTNGVVSLYRLLQGLHIHYSSVVSEFLGVKVGAGIVNYVSWRA
jgi:hypothetical protein